MKHNKISDTKISDPLISQSKRNALKLLGVGAGSLLLSNGALALTPRLKKTETDSKANTETNCDNSLRNRTIPYLGQHQAGVITPEQKEAIFIACNITATTQSELQQLFKKLTTRIAFLTQAQPSEEISNDRFPPMGSGMLGNVLFADQLTITVSVGNSLFDERFGFANLKPKKLTEMKPFPNDRLESHWCQGDIVLQFCANSRETVIFALRDILKNVSDGLYPLWKIDGFLPAKDIECKTTPINLFGFKDGTGNAASDDSELMDQLVWVTEQQKEPAWALNGSYQALRLIRFGLEFWDRTPLEDQENDFGRHKASGAPMGKQHEMDSPEYEKDPHGDRILFDSHMRRAEPRNPHRHTSKLRRRSYSYSLGLTPSGQLDMGLIFISYQNDLKKGFIDTQKRLNGEPLERYIKPFGGGYYFVLPGITNEQDYLAKALFIAAQK